MHLLDYVIATTVCIATPQHKPEQCSDVCFLPFLIFIIIIFTFCITAVMALCQLPLTLRHHSYREQLHFCPCIVATASVATSHHDITAYGQFGFPCNAEVTLLRCWPLSLCSCSCFSDHLASSQRHSERTVLCSLQRSRSYVTTLLITCVITALYDRTFSLRYSCKYFTTSLHACHHSRLTQPCTLS